MPGSAETPPPSAGPWIGGLELVGRERRDRLGVRGQELAEALVEQWAVVEVGAQRHDHVQSALGVGGRHTQVLQEQLALVFVRESS